MENENKNNEVENEKKIGEISGELLNLLKKKFRSELKGGSPRVWFNDFCKFKIMVLPILVSVIYIFACIMSIGLLICMMGLSFAHNAPGQGILCLVGIIVAPFMVHIAFELLMLPFAILDTLKQIRDKMP